MNFIFFKSRPFITLKIFSGPSFVRAVLPNLPNPPADYGTESLLYKVLFNLMKVVKFQLHWRVMRVHNLLVLLIGYYIAESLSLQILMLEESSYVPCVTYFQGSPYFKVNSILFSFLISVNCLHHLKYEA